MPRPPRPVPHRCGRIARALACGMPLLLAACGPEVQPPPSRPRDPAAATSLPARLAAADPAHGASLFRRCAACHTLGEGAPDTDGPNLHAVVNGPVAQRRPRFPYTAALTAIGGTWTPARLDAWLTSPRTFVPGTSMAFAGLPDARDRADVIVYLQQKGAGR